MGGRTLRAERHEVVRVRLSCESVTAPCSGKLELAFFSSLLVAGLRGARSELRTVRLSYAVS
jgi:hypothetical protein